MSAVKAHHYDVILQPVVTEKSTLLSEAGKIAVYISERATKSSVREAFEGIYAVKVAKVNVVNIRGKNKLFRGIRGRRSDVRKAYITLADGQSIDLFTGVK
jgi:large subunit ribosomal protein L23